MSTPKFTPGPWTNVADPLSDATIEGADKKVVAIIGTATKAGEANATLIAAAPDMAEAMRYAIERLRTARTYGPDMASSRDVCIKDALDLLLKALDQATKA